MVRPPHEVVGCLIVVYIVVGKTLVRVMVAEGAAEKEKEERERETTEKREKQGREAGFLSTLDSIFFILMS